MYVPHFSRDKLGTVLSSSSSGTKPHQLATLIAPVEFHNLKTSTVFQVDMCLFDKTGTLTSDKLVAETLLVPHPGDASSLPATVTLAGDSSKSRSANVPHQGLGSSAKVCKYGEQWSMEPIRARAHWKLRDPKQLEAMYTLSGRRTLNQCLLRLHFRLRSCGCLTPRARP